MQKGSPASKSKDFDRFVAFAQQCSARVEISLAEVPAPQKLAPFAYALSADVALDADNDVATGRFVLLHDPAGQEAWEGTFRCVTFVRAAIEDELQSDPLMPQVGWSWFLESLRETGAQFRAESGTVTRVASASFGQLSPQDDSSEIEIRASWTPEDGADLERHLQAWISLLSITSGLNPLPEGVASLPTRR
ncbi:MAG: hypothetical protein RLZZ251_899 [Actinomycetota bacterium]|jgi:hypothetical protein